MSAAEDATRLLISYLGKDELPVVERLEFMRRNLDEVLSGKSRDELVAVIETLAFLGSVLARGAAQLPPLREAVGIAPDEQTDPGDPLGCILELQAVFEEMSLGPTRPRN